MNGRGIFWWPDGKKYAGDFVADEFQGHGIKTWPNGKKYEGQFVDDEFEGSAGLAGCSGISVVEERLSTWGLEALGGIEFALAVGDRFFTGEPLGLGSEELRFSKRARLVVTGDL